VALSDDVQKLAKNQLAIQKSLQYLDQRLTALEGRVGDLDDQETAVKETKKAAAPLKQASRAEAKAEPKETSKPIENLGFKIFGGVGFLLILIGTYFLYDYAVKAGMISFLGRVVIGVLFALAFIVAGEVFRRKEYLKFSQLITGGGLGLLYFVFFATYHFPTYRQALGMTLGMNTILLFVVMIVAVFLALRHDSVVLAGFAFFLGYLAAGLTGLDNGATHQMMIYTLLLSVGIVILLWQKNWKIGVYPAIASYILYAIFFGSKNVISHNYGAANVIPPIVGPAFVYLAAFFVLFNAAAILLKEDDDNIQNIVIAVINAFAFFGFGLAIMLRYWSSSRGVFVIALAAFFLFMTFLAKQRNLKNLFEAFFVLSITFLTIAIPVQLEHQWITIAWAVEGCLLVWSGVRVENRGLRLLGGIVLAIAAGRMLFYDSWALHYGWRTVTFLIVIAALYAAAGVLSLLEKKDDELFQGLLAAAATIILTVMFAVELLDYKGALQLWTGNSRQVALSVVWAAEAIALIVAGFVQRVKLLRVFGLILFAITVGKVLFFDLGALSGFSRIIVTILVGILSLAGAFLYVKNKEKINAYLEE